MESKTNSKRSRYLSDFTYIYSSLDLDLSYQPISQGA